MGVPHWDSDRCVLCIYNIYNKWQIEQTSEIYEGVKLCTLYTLVIMILPCFVECIKQQALK